MADNPERRALRISRKVSNHGEMALFMACVDAYGDQIPDDLNLGTYVRLKYSPGELTPRGQRQFRAAKALSMTIFEAYGSTSYSSRNLLSKLDVKLVVGSYRGTVAALKLRENLLRAGLSQGHADITQRRANFVGLDNKAFTADGRRMMRLIPDEDEIKNARAERQVFIEAAEYVMNLRRSKESLDFGDDTELPGVTIGYFGPSACEESIGYMTDSLAERLPVTGLLGALTDPVLRTVERVARPKHEAFDPHPEAPYN